MKKQIVFHALGRWGRVLVILVLLAMSLVSGGCDFWGGKTEGGGKNVDHVDPQPVVDEEMTPKELNKKHGPSVVNVYSDKALGSGVIYKIKDGYGYIVTNDHVIRGASSLSIRLSDKRTMKAELRGTDRRADIAVIKVEGDKLQVAEFADSNKVENGIKVVAIGNAKGSENSIDDGLISNTEVTTSDADGKNINKYLQTSASINPGNSGGPLFDMYGKVVGINDMGISDAQNMNFAIPSNKAKEIADKLINNGYVSYPYLGVEAENERTKGGTAFILVGDIMKDSPADKAGLRKGDIIYQINDADVHTVAELRQKLNSWGIGASVSVNYVRNTKQGYQKYNVQVILEELPKGYYTFDWS